MFNSIFLFSISLNSVLQLIFVKIALLTFNFVPSQKKKTFNFAHYKTTMF